MHFLELFFTTYYETIIKPDIFIKKILSKQGQSQNPYLYSFLSLLVFFSSLSSLSKSDDDSLILYFRNFSNFFSDGDLINKMLIVTPLLIASETFLFVLSRVFVDKAYRPLYLYVYRYFTSSLLLTLIILMSLLKSLFFVLIFFNIRNIQSSDIGLIIGTGIPVLLAVFFAIDVGGLFPNKKDEYINSFRFLPFCSIAAMFGCLALFVNFYEFYDLKISPAKIHVSSIESEHLLVLINKGDSTNKGDNERDNLANLKMFKKVSCTLLMKNNSSKEMVIELDKFELHPTFEDGVIRRSKALDSASFKLSAIKQKATKDSIIILKPKEGKIVEMSGALTVDQMKFIQHHNKYSDKFILHNIYNPAYSDKSNEVFEKLGVVLEGHGPVD